MGKTAADVHRQFSEFFPGKHIRGYLYLLSKYLAEGRVSCDVEKLVFDDLPADYAGLLTEPYDLAADPLVGKPGSAKPFILDGGLLYMRRYFMCEEVVASCLVDLASGEQRFALKRKELLQHAHLPEWEEGSHYQKLAVRCALTNAVTIITGGPGTGKTTTLLRILTGFISLNPAGKTLLAAPTAKAASRIAEAITCARPDASLKKAFDQLQPTTVHRLLYPSGTYLGGGPNRKLDCDLIIIDEASMLGTTLFAHLLSALPPATQLVLTGDQDQLSSVDPGSIFADLCRSAEPNLFSDSTAAETPGAQAQAVKPFLTNRFIKLTDNYRFRKDGGIGRLSEAILAGMLPETVSEFQDDEVEICADSSVIARFAILISRYISTLETRVALTQLNRYRVLCAVNEGPRGVKGINQAVEAELIQLNCIRIDSPFYENRPIAITKNESITGLVNGEIGIVRTDPADGEKKAWFASTSSSQLKSYPLSVLPPVETAFATSIHKSQGSEFDEVLIILPAEESPVLSKELLYTAVTRAKQKATIWGSARIIAYAASRSLPRTSGFVARLTKITQ